MDLESGNKVDDDDDDDDDDDVCIEHLSDEQTVRLNQGVVGLTPSLDKYQRTPGRLKPHTDTEIDEEKIILKQVTIILNNSAMKMLTVCALLCAMVALTGAYPGILKATQNPIPTDTDTTTTTITTTPNLPVTEDPFGGWRPYCPDGWTMFNTRCLLYVPKNMTWAQAEQHCRYMTGNLASVINTEYSDQIQKVLQSAGQKSKQIWVGGYNTPERSWSWTDPYLFHGFHDWCIHSDVEPENPTVESKNHCLQITFEENASGCLDDMQCDAELPSVCSIIIM
ncbi:hypothetical protein PFLUV_G00075820 [Perca fluviatilis]|uniref:C-type lectin domain-containing protein n=1 Tax=Perca fluviatilis TaxID=8168 RepID=A0A6A5FF76_PERFL|nr:hypothetical protein PFLUV_G00075820 [Perca fluviatilis]